MLAFALAACGMFHENIYPYVNPNVVIPPAPSPIDAPADMPAFTFAPLTPQALMAHVQRLASDQFEGRAPGTHGETLTVDYVERAFRTAGLTPGVPVGANAASWEQAVPLISATIINNPVLQIAKLAPPPTLPLTPPPTTAHPVQLLPAAPPADARAYTYGDDFVVWTKSTQPHVALENAELVFVGYGIVNRELGWDDYAGLDMHGKIAVILVNDPDAETGDDRGFRGRAMTYYGHWRYKFEEAARQGAAGALLIHETGAAGYSWDVVRATWTGRQLDLQRADPNAGHTPVEGWLSEPAARDLFTRAGHDFAQEKVRAQRPDFTPLPLGLTASLAIDTQIETSLSRNVIGVLPGRSQPGEAVLYTAHWDHLGPCPAVDGDDICNGAVDNATGVAGLIELARRFAGEPHRRRSIVFIAFTGREAGLLGSDYYAAHPVLPLVRTAALINIEGLSTLGPARDISLVSDGHNDLEDALEQAAQAEGRALTDEPHPERGGFFRSDQFTFARLGVPVLLTSPGLDLYTGGVTRGRALWDVFLTQHDHKPSDQFSPTWDMTAAFRDLQLLHAVGARVSDSSDWPNWRAGDPYRALRDTSGRSRQ